MVIKSTDHCVASIHFCSVNGFFDQFALIMAAELPNTISGVPCITRADLFGPACVAIATVIRSHLLLLRPKFLIDPELGSIWQHCMAAKLNLHQNRFLGAQRYLPAPSHLTLFLKPLDEPL